MHTADPHCNALQSVVGIFLHATNTPDKVIKVFSRMGTSISVTSITRAIHSLSQKSYVEIEALGRTLLTSYAYDNFDQLLKTLIPTKDGRAERGLLHMTSGTLLRLEHGVTTDDLKCARLLWDRNEFNVRASDPKQFDALDTLRYLYSLHPEPEYVDGELGRHGRYRSWVFIQTLIKYGPAFFSRYASHLANPEEVESIPIVKLHQVPLRAMDINQSTTAGNIEAINHMFSQVGIGDKHMKSERTGEPLVDSADYVTLVHGDLGTYERVLTALHRRSIERTPYSRLDSVVFVLGLFHLKMAAADTIWRLLVTPKGARTNETSFMKIAGRLRPKDSSRLVSGGKFREQHELVQHVGAILRLDAWRVEVQKRTGKKTLEEWAVSTPSLGDVQEIADTLALEYVEGDGKDLYQLRRKKMEERDLVLENTMRTHHYLLLYEELSYSMNAGDIGRLETLLPGWVSLFRAAGKHKYGTQTLRFMHALYFIYPEGLRCVHTALIDPLLNA